VYGFLSVMIQSPIDTTENISTGHDISSDKQGMFIKYLYLVVLQNFLRNTPY
jgi:hypothetical protein